MRILARIFQLLYDSYKHERSEKLKNMFNLDKSVRLNYPENTFFHGNILIGENTYINGARIVTGSQSKVVIGKWCAIGHNVNIITRTHHPRKATGERKNRPIIEKDVVIGDHVWVGTNVFIREGVTLGDQCIVGANSVVTKSFPAKSVIAGCPARLISTVDEYTVEGV